MNHPVYTAGDQPQGGVWSCLDRCRRATKVTHGHTPALFKQWYRSIVTPPLVYRPCGLAADGMRKCRLKVKLHYAYKVRNLVRCIRDCAVVLLRFCGLQTPQKRNSLFTVAWHRTEFDGCLRVIIITARQLENSDIRFSSLTSQHDFNINGNLKK